MDWADAHIDNHLIATYVSSSSPPTIKVYNVNGTFYKSVPLTSDAMDLSSLALSDGRVYYSEYDNTRPVYWRNESVYEYDLSSDERHLIYQTAAPQQSITRIAADGDHIVMRGGVSDRQLLLYSRFTQSVSTIATSKSAIQGLSIDGDRILWGCDRADTESGREIHIYTISTGIDYVIPESKSPKTFGYGDISGNYAVWVMSAKDPDYINGVPVASESYDIRLTDLASGKTQIIETSQTAPMVAPFISGNTIVWVKAPRVDYNTTDTGTIRTYDISSGTISDVTSGVSSISDFDNGIIVWQKLKPMSFWVTSVPGKPVATIPATTVSKSLPSQGTTVPASPVELYILVSAVTVGTLAHALLRRDHDRQI